MGGLVTKQRRGRLYGQKVLMVGAILVFFWLALDSMTQDSPTMDEQNHLARGLAFLRTGDPRLSVEHPPLVNSLSALPVLLLPDVRLPLDHPSWEAEQGWYQFADLLLWEYNHDVTRMIFLARLPVVFLTLGLALIGFRLAGMVWGRETAVFPFLFLLFDPNILAHGRYVTTDVGGTTFLMLAVLAVWWMWQTDSPSFRQWLVVGVSLGLAFGSKLSTLAFVPILALAALWPINGRFEVRTVWRRWGLLGTAVIPALIVVWIIFGFQWGTFHFRSDQLAHLNRFAGPMPTFWAGIEQILFISSGGRPAFLLGQFSNEGFPLYFPVAFLVKTPLALLLALPVAVISLWQRKETRPIVLFLLTPPVIYLVLSMQSALNIGYRHLLPMLPFLWVLVAGMARRGQRLWWVPWLVVAGLWLADAGIHPHYLSYFNMAAGGPENGRNILVDSNIDWGQDLIRLKQWMAANGVERVKLAWFGTAVPEYYHIQYDPLPGFPRHPFYGLWTAPPFNPAQPEPGIYAISVTNLWELPLADKYVYAWFRARPPDDRVGYSILIYYVPSPAATTSK